MKKIVSFCLIVSAVVAKSQTWSTNEQYIQQFAPYAVEEMELYKIPASITLAQGLLETAGGQSRLAQQGKNHFGIKCKETWTGKTMSHTDDAPNECFRVYDSPRDSYRDHSLFLTQRKHYSPLFLLNVKDYKAWAYGLKKAGYATSPTYAPALIKRIEQYKLYEFDEIPSSQVYTLLLQRYPDLKNDAEFMAKLGPKNVNIDRPNLAKEAETKKSYAQQAPSTPKKSTPKEILEDILLKNHPNGDLKYIVIPDKINLSYISKKFGIAESRLMKYNELTSRVLQKNQILFLESKNSSSQEKTYVAQAGETMHDIAQKFAIKLSKLYKKNRMNEGQQPKAGQLVYLDSKKPRN
ncbi:glucosaminidase domain-containing protein [Elizabethkingia sp. JS20170427COW]|uniref:glucosaminidase domain-containing protein n=1 Tax=Elizabethkingia sp. JS20170427COW TaxID=2583851 RepID=UPI001110C2B6|nr:glucosaminidase domain-containing protein [Elizabethkingia sp. JS20170427COW]QCX52605.1 LysM peptidoglycan-binding domain-containing protein [Elizabethkingia sp. JS20170427COW]